MKDSQYDVMGHAGLDYLLNLLIAELKVLYQWIL